MMASWVGANYRAIAGSLACGFEIWFLKHDVPLTQTCRDARDSF
ncbi:MAG TPA: hypothetical protein VEV17_04725 [Bryobacteraceae bacterium]|nr:hypothetical protein [Bryobacteraceae bacterium]